MRRRAGETGSRSRLLAAAVAAAALLQGAGARADGISGPSCPPGSQEEFCHWEGYCIVLGCTDDTDCPAGRVCGEIEHCMGTASCDSDPQGDGGTYTVESVVGVCGVDAGCTGECETHRVCLDPGDAGIGGGAGGDCSCRAAGPGPARLAFALVVAAAAVVLARVRSRG